MMSDEEIENRIAELIAEFESNDAFLQEYCRYPNFSTEQDYHDDEEASMVTNQMQIIYGEIKALRWVLGMPSKEDISILYCQVSRDITQKCNVCLDCIH